MGDSQESGRPFDFSGEVSASFHKTQPRIFTDFHGSSLFLFFGYRWESVVAFFEANYWVEMVKFTVMRASVSTASPDCRYGLKRHCFTASRAAVERMVGPLRTCKS